ncbi:MAG TPA: TetR/AcrR family transcriptional regulator [Planctomycetaceae bacterium]|nr:TetR/AcrR family transcriptional regulator [Planctomycetaceae bacterium]
MSAEISSNIAEGILQAAVRLFARKGYEATSTREIVEAAGVTKPMIYYYFKNKEGLYEAVLTRFLSQFAVRLRAVVDEPREPRDHLVEVVWAHLEYCREHRDFAKFFYAVFFGPEESAVADSLVSMTRQVQDLLIEACQRAVANGLVKPERIEALVTALQAMINLGVIATVKEGAVLARDLAVQIVDIVLDGVAH